MEIFGLLGSARYERIDVGLELQMTMVSWLEFKQERAWSQGRGGERAELEVMLETISDMLR